MESSGSGAEPIEWTGDSGRLPGSGFRLAPDPDGSGLWVFLGVPERGALTGLRQAFGRLRLPAEPVERRRFTRADPRRGDAVQPAWRHHASVRSTVIQVDPSQTATAAVIAVGRIGASIVLTPEGAYGRLVFGWPTVRTAGPCHSDLIGRAREACVDQYSLEAARLFGGMRAVESGATPLFSFGSSWPVSAGTWREQVVRDTLTGIFVPGPIPPNRRGCGASVSALRMRPDGTRGASSGGVSVKSRAVGR